MAVMKGIMGARYGTVMTLHYNSALDFIKGKQLETEMKICAVVLKRSRPGGEEEEEEEEGRERERKRDWRSSLKGYYFTDQSRSRSVLIHFILCSEIKFCRHVTVMCFHRSAD